MKVYLNKKSINSSTLNLKKGNDIKNFFSFGVFKKAENGRFKNIPDAWLEWFIGFVEGDGYFAVDKKQVRLRFGIHLAKKDFKILEEIKNVLGFGEVVFSSKTSVRFYVGNLKDLTFLIYLFNGNLVFPVEQQKFLTFLTVYNNKISKGQLSSRKNFYLNFNMISYIHNLHRPSLENAWLSGLIDAEGCFRVQFDSRSKGVTISFNITQYFSQNKQILDWFVILFKTGTVYSAKRNINEFSFQIQGISNCFSVISYLDKFSLRTIKNQSFYIWKTIHLTLVEKKHLDLEFRKLIIEQSKKINKN